MRQLTIRRIEDEVYEDLKARARRNDRSLEAEARAILAERLRPDRRELAAAAAEIRTRSKPYPGDLVADIRADRERRT